MGHKGDDYTSVFLPYGEDERFAMVAVLPDDMDAFLSSLDAQKLNAVLTTFETQQDPVLSLPVFELEEKIKLKDVLRSLGIQKAFTDGADFSPVSDTPLAIDEVLHKARIKVDEQGTEAAAVTAVIIRATGAMLDRFEFVADKPFLFFIVDTQNELTLFTGRVMDLD
jgi:serpin B